MLAAAATHHDNAPCDGGIIQRCAVLAEHCVARVKPILLRHVVYLLHDKCGMASSLSKHARTIWDVLNVVGYVFEAAI